MDVGCRGDSGSAFPSTSVAGGAIKRGRSDNKTLRVCKKRRPLKKVR